MELLRIWEGHRVDDRLRHALDRRGGLPLDPRRRDVAAAGADRRRSSTSTCRSRAPRHARGAALLRARHRGARAAARASRRGRATAPEEGAASSRRRPSARHARARSAAPRLASGPRRLRRSASRSGSGSSADFDIQNFLLPPPSASLRRSGRPQRALERRPGSPSRRRSAGFVIGCARGDPRRGRCSRASGCSAARCCPTRSPPTPSRSSRSRRSRTTGSAPSTRTSKMAIAAMLCFFPVMVNTLRGPDVGAARSRSS